MTSNGEALIALAGHDRELAKLTHQRADLPERAALTANEVALGAVQTEHDEVDRRLARVASEERRIDADAQDVKAKADGVERKLYSGEVTSPKELQALQADLELLRARQRLIEDGALEVMEQHEGVRAELAAVTARRDTVVAEGSVLAAALAAAQSTVDDLIAQEHIARDAAARVLPAPIAAAYDKAKSLAGTDGAARLVGLTCQGCHLSIGTIEAESIRKHPELLAPCEHCSRILVP